MNEQIKNNPKPVLTIIASVLCILHLFILIYCLISFITSTFSVITLIIALAVFPASLVFAIICRRERIKILRVLLLVMNIILVALSTFTCSLGLIQMGIKESKEQRRDEAQGIALRYVDVNYIKTILPEKNLYLGNGCYDEDGVVVSQFISMDFTGTMFEITPYLNPDPFYENSDCTVTFFTDYSGLLIESHVDRSGVGYGHIYFEYSETYSVDIAEGKKLQNLIESIIK